MGIIYQSKNIDYNISKKEYKILSKARKKAIAPTDKESQSLFRNLSIKNFLDVYGDLEKTVYKTSNLGEIAIEEYKRRVDNTSSPKISNIISLIAVGLSLASVLLSIYSLYLQSLHP